MATALRREDLLEALGQRVAPVVLAHERVLPAPIALRELLPDGGLVRGRVMSCRGPAATALALSLVAPASTAGSWVAAIDVPTVGLDAASEMGVVLERVVAVSSSGRWGDVVVAAADGFDLVLTRVPEGLRSGIARAVVSRLRRSGAVLVLLGDPGVVACDGVLDTADVRWDGLGHGCGHLERRTVEVQAGGRRLPGCRRISIRLPAASVGVAAEIADEIADEIAEP